MNRFELAARNILRKTPVPGIISNLRHRFTQTNDRQLRDEYARNRPDRATITFDGHEVILHVASVEEYVHYLAEPEHHILKNVLGRLRAGDTTWDVGANIGFYTMLMAKAVGAGGEVFAFEPGKTFFDRLCLNAELNKSANVRPMKLALSSRADQLQLAIDPSGHLEGDHRLVRQGDSLEGRPMETVDVVAGDQLRDEKSLRVPALIKIDVQGFEEDVLEGLSRTLREPACRSVICEIHFGILAGQGRGDSPLRIEKHLKSCGFHLTRLDRNHIAADKP